MIESVTDLDVCSMTLHVHISFALSLDTSVLNAVDLLIKDHLVNIKSASTRVW